MTDVNVYSIDDIMRDASKTDNPDAFAEREVGRVVTEVISTYKISPDGRFTDDGEDALQAIYDLSERLDMPLVTSQKYRGRPLVWDHRTPNINVKEIPRRILAEYRARQSSD